MHHGLFTITHQPYGALRLANIPPALRTLTTPPTITYKNLTHTLDPTHGPIPLDLVPWALTHYTVTPSLTRTEDTPSQTPGELGTPTQLRSSTVGTVTPLTAFAAPDTETLTSLGALQLPETVPYTVSSVDVHETETKLDATILVPHTDTALPLENTAVETAHLAKIGNSVETHAVVGPVEFYAEDCATYVDTQISLSVQETENTVDETFKQPQPLHAELPQSHQLRSVEEKVSHTAWAHCIDRKIESNTTEPVVTNIRIDDGAVVPTQSTVALGETCTELHPHIFETTDTLKWVLGTVEVKDAASEIDDRTHVSYRPTTELPYTCNTDRTTQLEDTVLVDPYYLTDVTGYSLLPGLFFDDTMDLHTAGRDVTPVDETKAWAVKSYNEQVEGDFTLVDIDPRRETPDFSLHDLV